MRNIALVGSTANSMIGFRKSLIQELVSRRLSVYCFANDYDNETRDRVRLFGGIPIDYSIDRSRVGLVLIGLETLRLGKLLKLYQVDCVFSFFTKPSVVAMLAGRLYSVSRRVAMLEGLGSTFTDFGRKVAFRNQLLRFFQSLLISFSFGFSHKVVFLNEDDPNDLRKYWGLVPWEKIKILRGIGVEFNGRKPSTKSPYRGIKFIFIGRLIREKGVYDYIAVAEKLLAIYPNCIFTLVGDIDPDNPSSLTLDDVAELKRKTGIRYLGFLKDVYSELNLSDVLVLPSYREGFPKVVMEAMAMGCPVVGYNVPGMRDAVSSGVTGFLVPNGDRLALFSALEGLINNPSAVSELGVNAYETACEKFNANDRARELADIILFD